jgi:hypothetical protein
MTFSIWQGAQFLFIWYCLAGAGWNWGAKRYGDAGFFLVTAFAAFTVRVY